MTQQLLPRHAMSGHVAPAPMFQLAVRRELLRLADLEDAMAAQEATSVPYWEPCPSTVLGHRQAARTLRAEAERLLALAPDEGALS